MNYGMLGGILTPIFSFIGFWQQVQIPRDWLDIMQLSALFFFGAVAVLAGAALFIQWAMLIVLPENPSALDRIRHLLWKWL